MSIATLAAATDPVGLVSWDDEDETWYSVRAKGCGASDVAALLGFSTYRSPWQVWAEKVDHPQAPEDRTSEAAELGHQLEPWLLGQAGRLLTERDGHPVMVRLPKSRLFRHAEHGWRRCSPDGVVTGTRQLVQAKTAGLQTGRAHGWTDDGFPLGYELQCRWEMHVMDAELCHLVALVAGRGLCLYTIERDMTVEYELVSQVDPWWQKYVVAKQPPPLGGLDAKMVAALYPRSTRQRVDLDDVADVAERWHQAYVDARAQEKEAKTVKAAAGTELKALIGDAELAYVGGRHIATWSESRSNVDWQRMARELYAAQHPDGDVDTVAETYRPAPSRSLTVKD